ncbi:hypothetical protein M9H77_21255 [Catharanthus roseus]|uniref:Uncharacterized protein n=1 Tax=Catharanthus roseus TaxID=4058 RepID=A0ACC0ALR9_CATRO|nr:hypothetical protein M9H77_21255 [Catharanthus roseus]
MSDFIPEEILVQIFKRVPPKSLVRFRCVSKSWNSLVSSSYFVTLQNEWARASSRSILTGHFSRMQLYSIRRKNEVFSVENEVKKAFPFEYKRYNKSFRIIGSCNGLICLCYDESEFETQFILWNPSIGKRIALPLPRVTFENSVRSSEFGFGYDTESNDFKVVRLTGLKRENEEDDFPPIFEVFSLSRGKWREINPSPSQNWIVQFSRSFAFVNGKLHWLAYNLYNNVKKKVQGFDLTHEVFDEMSLPELSGESIKEVAVDKDSLVLLAYGPLPSGISYDDKMYWGQQCSVWAMEEYGDGKSWTKMFRVHFEELLSLRKPSSKVLFGRVLVLQRKVMLCW